LSHDQPTKSTFRKVSTNTWTDKKVRALSPMLPSGQALFVMLLIGPQTTNIPGVQPVGRLAFAEMLEWEPEAFDEAFAEVFAQGLVKADWKARLIFVPNAIQHNLPQSPNVVKSWGVCLDAHTRLRPETRGMAHHLRRVVRDGREFRRCVQNHLPHRRKPRKTKR